MKLTSLEGYERNLGKFKIKKIKKAVKKVAKKAIAAPITIQTKLLSKAANATGIEALKNIATTIDTIANNPDIQKQLLATGGMMVGLPPQVTNAFTEMAQNGKLDPMSIVQYAANEYGIQLPSNIGDIISSGNLEQLKKIIPPEYAETAIKYFSSMKQVEKGVLEKVETENPGVINYALTAAESTGGQTVSYAEQYNKEGKLP